MGCPEKGYALAKGISAHIAKGPLVLDGSLPATITATILGLAAQIERELIPARTKEALARRKTQGLRLGRLRGPAAHVKLDKHKEQILSFCPSAMGTPVPAIAPG
ncbi:MAG TPA: hypothetical protein VGC99_23880 [Candidatus Tectomicrobia bacterium]